MIEANSTTYKILHSKSVTYKFIRFMVFGPIGFGVGYLFWYLSLQDSDVISGLAKDILQWAVIGAFSLGCIFIPIVRCMSFITMVNLAFGEGQAVVKISILMSINEVLIYNLMKNYRLASDSMKCNMVLAQNYSKTRYNLLNEPTKSMLFNMVGGAQESQRVVGVVEDVFVPLETEFVDESETNLLEQQRDQELAKHIVLDKGDPVMEKENKNVDPKDVAKEDARREKQLTKFKTQIAQIYSKKMFLRCESIFDTAYDTCYTKCDGLYDACLWILSWTFMSDKICQILHPSKLCYLFRVLKKRDEACFEGDHGIPQEMKGLEEELAAAAQASQEVLNNFEVNVQFEAQIPLRRLKIFSVEQAFSRIDANFAALQSILGILQTIFIVVRLAFVGVSLYLTFKWLKSYLSNVTHENILITGEFMEIDQRRQLERRQNFEKFRKFELRRVNTRWWQPRLSKAERNRMFKGVFELGYLAVFVLIFTYTATTFYNLLNAVYMYSHFEWQQVGYHQLSMTVTGTGFLSNIVRSILKDFNKSVEINQTLDNEECRIQPQELNWSSYDGITWIWLLYGILFLQKIFFAYIIRLRVVFASISFPDRAHTRVLWLYNDMLDVRYKRFFFAKDAMESWIDEPEKIPQESSSSFLLRNFPQMCFFQKFFVPQNCFICDDKTNKKNKKRYCIFHNVYYCDICLTAYPCFNECYACRVFRWRQHFYAPTTAKVPFGRANFQCYGFLICRETLALSWQFLLLQSRQNSINWSPPKGVAKEDESPLEAAVRITFEETGLHNCNIKPIQGDSYHLCDYDFNEKYHDCVVYPTAKIGYKKVIYYVGVVKNPDTEIFLSQKHIDYGWFDVERACKFAMYQNCPSAFLKADYFVRKVLPSAQNSL